MNETVVCPLCKKENVYFDGSLNICPDCGYEWAEGDEETTNEPVTRDSNGTPLSDGDSVTVIKTLDVKGSPMVIKRGTRIKNIRLTGNPEEVDCKVDGSSIVLKSCFLKK